MLLIKHDVMLQTHILGHFLQKKWPKGYMVVFLKDIKKHLIQVRNFICHKLLRNHKKEKGQKHILKRNYWVEI